MSGLPRSVVGQLDAEPDVRRPAAPSARRRRGRSARGRSNVVYAKAGAPGSKSTWSVIAISAMPRSSGGRRVDVDRDVAVGRQVGVEVGVERQVARLVGRRRLRGATRASPGDEAELAADPVERVERAMSSCSSAWAAVTIVRSRALSSATVGKTTGWAKTPSSKSRSLNRPAVSGSPIITGVIGVSERPVSKPSRVSSALNRRRVRPQPLLQLGLVLHDPDRLAAGGHDGRRMRGREEERPGALDQDLAQGLRAGDVAAERRRPPSTACRPGWRPGRAARSGRPMPRPLRPSTPEAWASSTKTAAPNASAASTMPGERRDVAVHREDAVGHDQDQPVRSPPPGRPVARGLAQDLAQRRRRRRAGRPCAAPSRGACRR